MQDKNICPKCGKEKEEFAVAWNWELCFNCSVELKKQETENRGNSYCGL